MRVERARLATCGRRTERVADLRRPGFPVKRSDGPDPQTAKTRHGGPGALQACHSAPVSGYVVEGHAPAALVARLLRACPPVLGLAVPGMPAGSPGMERPAARADRCQVLPFGRSGQTAAFATR